MSGSSRDEGSVWNTVLFIGAIFVGIFVFGGSWEPSGGRRSPTPTFGPAPTATPDCDMKSRETDGWAPSSYDLCKDNERERDYRAMHDGSGWEPSANDEGACVGGRFEDC